MRTSIKRYKYRGSAPISTHFRVGTCEEARCEAFLFGWKTILDRTDEGLVHLARNSGRKYTEDRQPSGLIEFTFEAGQTCFQEHLVSLEREPFLSVARTGDSTLHLVADDWVDHFATNQIQLKELIDRG